MKKLIEMVCTGNNGRSPVAELIARNTLESVGAIADYDSISSGTSVDYSKDFLAGRITEDHKMVGTILGLARKSGFYSEEQLSEIDRATAEKDYGTLLSYAINASERLMTVEQEHRDRVVSDLGIRGTIKLGKDQTVARPETVAVLTMDKGNRDKVGKIYALSSYAPGIDILTRFATGKDGEVTNAFGGDVNVYKTMVEQLLEEVPLAVDKVLNS